MKVIDPGHRYELATLDSNGLPYPLQFVKRIGEKYPGNEPPACAGTTLQEVLRALIDRATYVNGQIPCAETEAAIGLLSTALLLLEVRAKRVKGSVLEVDSLSAVVDAETCSKCGHVRCEVHRAACGT